MSYKHLFNLNTNQQEKTATMVNHSGEIGAKQIYLGQIKAAKHCNLSQETINDLIIMLESELEHHQYFANKINSNTQFKPSVFDAIWKPFSFALGYASCFSSIQIAMLLTKQVETVIEKHYTEQLKELNLSSVDDNFIEKITQFLADEMEHKHIGDEGSQNIHPHLKIVFEKLFTIIVQTAIYISSRV